MREIHAFWPIKFDLTYYHVLHIASYRSTFEVPTVKAWVPTILARQRMTLVLAVQFVIHLWNTAPTSILEEGVADLVLTAS